MGTANSLSESQQTVYRNQRIPTFLEFLQLAKKVNGMVIFDIFLPPETHPYHNDTVDIILETIKESDIDPKLVSLVTNHLLYFVAD